MKHVIVLVIVLVLSVGIIAPRPCKDLDGARRQCYRTDKIRLVQMVHGR